MKREIKKKWIEALRSGEYQQGKSVLNDDNKKFCCLGVLCDLAVKAGVAQWENIDTEIDLNGIFDAISPKEILGNIFVIPPKIARWAGFRINKKKAQYLKISGISFFVNVNSYPEQQALNVLNDDKGYSFNMIADLIEKEELFAD